MSPTARPTPSSALQRSPYPVPPRRNAWLASLLVHAALLGLVAWTVWGPPPASDTDPEIRPVRVEHGDDAHVDAERMRESSQREDFESLIEPETPHAPPNTEPRLDVERGSWDDPEHAFDEPPVPKRVPTLERPTLVLPEAVAVWSLRELAERERARRAAQAAPATRAGVERLALVYAPDPRAYYPLLARRRGIEGVVRVRIQVDSDGIVVNAVIAPNGSSGHRLLDDAALRAARAMRFAPGVGGGAELPVQFRLK